MTSPRDRDPLRARFLFYLAASLLVFAACTDENAPTDRRKFALPAVEVTDVQQQDLPDTITAVGSLVASQEVVIRPEISGIVNEFSFVEGEAVRRGDLLFSLEDEEVRQRLRARRAALTAARAETENARKQLLRRRELLAEGTIAAETFDEVQTRYETSKARVSRLEAEVQEILEELENTQIRAPIDGIAGEHRIDPGDYVETGDPLVTIVRTDVLEIDFTVAQRYANAVAEGQQVTIQTSANPERVFEGRVFFVSPQLRENTRDLLIKARVENPDGLLRPGGFAEVELIVAVRAQTLVLPEEALVPTRTGYIVFVVRDQQAHRREVTIGLRRPGIVEIRQGLEPGETVIHTGHISVSDGDRVRIVDDSQP